MQRWILWVTLALGANAASGADQPEPPGRAHERPPSREAGDQTLRDPAQVAALIERLDAAIASGDALPVHALELSLRRAVERELAGEGVDRSRERALRIQNAERVGSTAEAQKRDDAYRTPVASWVDARDARDAPAAAPRRSEPPPVAAPDDADFERRMRAAVHDLSQLDGVLDDAGLATRRDLLLELLQVARARAQSRPARPARRVPAD